MKPLPTKLYCPCGSRLMLHVNGDVYTIFCPACNKESSGMYSENAAVKAFERVHNCKLEEIK